MVNIMEDTMKVYLFNVDGGLYAGEDFCDAGHAREEDGITTKAPPEPHPGHIRVYDQAAGNWKLVPAADLRARANDHD